MCGECRFIAKYAMLCTKLTESERCLQRNCDLLEAAPALAIVLRGVLAVALGVGTSRHHWLTAEHARLHGAAPLCTGGDDKVAPMSVKGVEGVFCVSGTTCAGQDGVCPGPQDRLEHGSYCGTVKAGVLDCKPNGVAPHKHRKSHTSPDRGQSKAAICSAPDQSPMSIEGVDGALCVSSPACAANVSTGACPDPQPGLPNGAVCGTVKTGVFGCKPVVPAGTDTESDSEDTTEGDSEDPKESSDERRRHF